MTFKDYFSSHAADYAKFRPTYPDSVFQFVSDKAPGHECAWDCGTGNGQAAIALSKYFTQVIATDASEAQIKQAFPSHSVTYKVAPAEKSGIESDSLDAVIAASALHWFDLVAFFNEAKRTLKRNGIIAVWCYGRATAAPELDEVVETFQQKTLKSYWAPELRHIAERYQGFEFPFSEIHPPGFDMSMEWTFRDFIGYLSTWSAMQSLAKHGGEEAIASFFQELDKAWGNADKVRTVKTPLFMRVGFNS